MLLPILGFVVAVAASPRHLLRRDDDSRVIVPLTRDNGGRYSAHIGMGPDGKRQEFHLALSTTSGYTVVAGSKCTSCTQQAANGPLYQPTNSPTYQTLNKNANLTVSGQQASGSLAKEECALRNQDGGWWTYPNQTIIVADSSTLPLASDVSGILGLATKAAQTAQDTFLGGLFISHPQWSNFTYGMAINGQGSGTNDGAGGALHLIDTDPSAYTGDVVTKNVLPSVVSIPVGDSSDEWTVHMDSYSFKAGSGGLEVGNSAGGNALIEPYVPSIILPQNEARTLYASINGAKQISSTSATDPISYSLPCSTTMSLTVNFGTLAFALTESDLLINNNGQCTGAIQGAADPTSTSYVLGNTFAGVAYIIFTTQRDSTTGTNSVGFALRANSRPANKVEVGAIVGGVLGTVAGLALIGFLGWYLFRKRKEERTAPSTKYKKESKPSAPGPLDLHASALSSNVPGPTYGTDANGGQYATVPQHSPVMDHIPTPYTYVSSDSPNPRQEKTFSTMSHVSDHSVGGPHSPTSISGGFTDGRSSVVGPGTRGSLTPALPIVAEATPVQGQSLGDAPSDLPPPSYAAAEAERPAGQRNFVTRAEKRVSGS